MAIVPMQKISLFVHKEDKLNVVDFLHAQGVLHISDADSCVDLDRMPIDEEGGKLDLTLAQLDFAVNFLSKYEVKKKGLQAMIDGDAVQINPTDIETIANGFEFQDAIARCQSVEEELNSLHNEEKDLISQNNKLTPWKSLQILLNAPTETSHTKSFFTVIPQKDWDTFKTELLNISDLIVIALESVREGNVHAHIIVDKELVSDINVLFAAYKTERVEFIAFNGTVTEKIENLESRLKQIKERNSQLNQATKELAKDLEKLRVVYDYVNWKRQRKAIRTSFASTDSVVIITGWLPKESLDTVVKGVTEITPQHELLKIEADKNEVVPVLMRSNSIVRPFRAVTGVFGLPLYNEVDPTPLLSVFFIIFFGLCLTDAGYGIIMFLVMFFVLRSLRLPKSMENMVRLLMFGGIFTFLIGILFGGWFGLEADQAPAWMTTVRNGELQFIGQRFNSLTNAIVVLILSFGLGYVQVWFGVLVNLIHNFKTQSKKEALLNDFPWVYILTMIGLFILAKTGVLPSSLNQPVLYLLYSALALIVLTQGRKKSNIFGKLFSGILSLYDLVGYMSDILSYSRLLALGLATAIVGMAVNKIALLAGGIPYVGFIFMAVVLIVGHVFNLAINALGSFIHSGRLQFVEFFGKFMEGGGKQFNPFARISRFVKIKR